MVQAFLLIVQYFVFVGPVDGDPWRGAARWIVNWVVLFAVQGCNEVRLWWAYKRSLEQPTPTTITTEPQFQRDSVKQAALWDSDKLLNVSAVCSKPTAGDGKTPAGASAPASLAGDAAGSAPCTGRCSRCQVAGTRALDVSIPPAELLAAKPVTPTEPTSPTLATFEMPIDFMKTEDAVSSDPAADLVVANPPMRLTQRDIMLAQALIQESRAKPYTRLAKYTTAKVRTMTSTASSITAFELPSWRKSPTLHSLLPAWPL